MKILIVFLLSISSVWAFSGKYILQEKNIIYHSLKDTYGIANKDPIWKTIPNFNFDYIQQKNDLLPLSIGLIITPGPLGYNYFLGTGKVIGKSKVSLPFALVEKNANCTHNGVLEIDVAKTKKNATIKLYQETCKYHKFNLTGTLNIRFIKNQSLKLDKKNIETIPQKGIIELHKLNPQIDLDKFHSHATKAHISSYGVYFNGIHYQGKCFTRIGEYEHCSEMILPSFSTAKTSLAGVAMLHFARQFGPEIFKLKIHNFVKESPHKKNDWSDVTFEDALDMITGHYLSKNYGEDEAGDVQSQFFLGTSRAQKMQFAFTYPKKEPAGKAFSYHTSDTYILAHALETYLQRNSTHRDLFEYLKTEVYSKAGIPEEFSSLRDWQGDVENNGTTWAGYGLWWKSDWLVKMARFIAIDQVKNPSLLHHDLLLKSLGRKTDKLHATGIHDYLYNNSFWIKEFGPKEGFTCSFKVPFMAGYGGIIVAMFPNDVIYYYVSDNDEKKWWPVAHEVNKISSFCNDQKK